MRVHAGRARPCRPRGVRQQVRQPGASQGGLQARGDLGEHQDLDAVVTDQPDQAVGVVSAPAMVASRSSGAPSAGPDAQRSSTAQRRTVSIAEADRSAALPR